MRGVQDERIDQEKLSKTTPFRTEILTSPLRRNMANIVRASPETVKASLQSSTSL